MHPAFCTPYFGPVFFQIPKSIPFLKTKIVGADWLGECLFGVAFLKGVFSKSSGNPIIVFWVRDFKFWILAYFFIFFNCAKFRKIEQIHIRQLTRIFGRYTKNKKHVCSSPGFLFKSSNLYVNCYMSILQFSSILESLIVGKKA